MFRPYEYQIDSDAAVVATGNQPEPYETPEYAKVRQGRELAKINFPRGRAYNPLGNAYQRMYPLYSTQGHRTPNISSLSKVMAGQARPYPNRMAARDSEQSVVVNNIPPVINPVSFRTSIIHRDIPLNRHRVERIYEHHATRGFAF